MATLAPDHTRTVPDAGPTTDPWLSLLAILAGTVAAVDLIFFALIATVIPPLAVGALLTAVGVALVRRRPRAATLVLGATSLIMLAGNVPFAVDHLGHPASAIDFTHAVVGTVGRVLAVVAAIGSWRRATPTGARRLAAIAVALAALTVLVATVAALTSSGDEAGLDDVLVPIERSAFPDPIAASVGDTLFVDNGDLFRHTFTVTGQDLDVELPATQGIRVPLDLDAGVYDVTCEVPGHEFMTTTLEVR